MIHLLIRKIFCYIIEIWYTPHSTSTRTLSRHFSLKKNNLGFHWSKFTVNITKFAEDGYPNMRRKWYAMNVKKTNNAKKCNKNITFLFPFLNRRRYRGRKVRIFTPERESKILRKSSNRVISVKAQNYTKLCCVIITQNYLAKKSPKRGNKV